MWSHLPVDSMLNKSLATILMMTHALHAFSRTVLKDVYCVLKAVEGEGQSRCVDRRLKNKLQLVHHHQQKSLVFLVLIF